MPSRMEAIEQKIHDYEERYPPFLKPDYQPSPEEAEEYKEYQALKEELNRAYLAASFKQFNERANEERIITNRILLEPGLGPVPEDLQVPSVNPAQPLPASNTETHRSGSAAQATPTEDEKRSSTSGEPQRVRRRKRRELTEREKGIVGILRAAEGKLRGSVYCWALEKKKIPPHPEWIAHGCPASYPEAYKLKKWTHRIQDEKYRLSQFLPKKRANHSSQTSVTRRKRVNL